MTRFNIPMKIKDTINIPDRDWCLRRLHLMDQFTAKSIELQRTSTYPLLWVVFVYKDTDDDILAMLENVSKSIHLTVSL